MAPEAGALPNRIKRTAVKPAIAKSIPPRQPLARSRH
jgi:hypothetical protein